MGTTFSPATAPTMPHMASSTFLRTFPVAARDLRLRVQCQHRRRNIAPHCRASTDGCAASDRHWRDKLRIGPDVHVVLDHRSMFVCAIVIANDRSGANVDILHG